jgi:hypothetical protein
VRERCERAWADDAEDLKEFMLSLGQVSTTTLELTGKPLMAPFESRAIPSEALGSTASTKEPLETRTTSSACSNWSHERPASLVDEDVVQTSRKLESWDKEPSEDIATN